MKIFNYQLPLLRSLIASFAGRAMINPKIFSFVFISLFIFVVGLGMGITANAQNPEPYVQNNSTVDEESTGSKDDEETVGPKDDEETVGPSGIFTLSNPLKVNSIGELLHSLVQVFTYLVILFAVIMFVYLGFQYVAYAAQGNAKGITELHTKFMWLVAGVAIVIGARVIIEVIINTLSATGTVSPDVIQSAQNALKK